MTRDDRDSLVDALLRHVPFDGWSARALRAAAGDAGVSPVALQRLFRHGVDDALAYWQARSDARMLAQAETLDLAGMRVRERIAALVRARIEVDAEHREALRRALAHWAMPQNTAAGMRALYATVDSIWRAAGDTATDWNFYTKRLLLAGVYASTLLYWLDDSSAGWTATWAFLGRRIDDVLKVPRTLGRVRACFPDVGRLVRRRRRRRAA